MVLLVIGFLYVIFARDSIISWVASRVDLPGAVQLPDVISSFHDKIGLSLLLCLLWPGEVYHIISVYQTRKTEGVRKWK